MIGWESTPPKKRGSFFTPGTKFGAEIGYTFGREFQFERGLPDQEFDNSLLLRATARF